MTLVSGYIKSIEGAAVPSASVIVLNSDLAQTGEGTAANSSGAFALNVDPANEPYILAVSSVGYKPQSVLLSSWQNGRTISLQGSYVTGEPVVVYSSPKKPFPLWLLALPLLAIADSNKRGKLSGIKEQDVRTGLLIGGGVIALTAGGKIINKLLTLLGFQDSQATQNIDNIFTAPPNINPWSPDFWRYGPPSQTRILTAEAADSYAKQIYDAINWYGDDEEKIFAVFRSMPTQSCVSYLAMTFRDKYGKDILSFLRGGSWYQPGADGLSDAELDKVNSIVLSLPKYW
jgi:hypothetical protein